VSRSLPAAATEAENALLVRARQCLATWERAEAMIRAGLYSAGTDPEVDVARTVWPGLDAFIGRSDRLGIRAAHDALAEVLAPAIAASSAR
jgi:flagellum-specific ATP synthase